MMLLKLWMFFGVNVPRGAAEEKKRGYLWRAAALGGIPRQHVVLIVARLGVWSTEELILK